MDMPRAGVGGQEEHSAKVTKKTWASGRLAKDLALPRPKAGADLRSGIKIKE